MISKQRYTNKNTHTRAEARKGAVAHSVKKAKKKEKKKKRGDKKKIKREDSDFPGNSAFGKRSPTLQTATHDRFADASSDPAEFGGVPSGRRRRRQARHCLPNLLHGEETGKSETVVEARKRRRGEEGGGGWTGRREGMGGAMRGGGEGEGWEWEWRSRKGSVIEEGMEWRRGSERQEKE